jgi:GTPase SAR1 family protein
LNILAELSKSKSTYREKIMHYYMSLCEESRNLLVQSVIKNQYKDHAHLFIGKQALLSGPVDQKCENIKTVLVGCGGVGKTCYTMVAGGE